MRYTLQADVALVSVCDRHFLVAAGEARGKVPYIKGVNAPGAYFWRLLEQQIDTEEIIRQAAKDYETSEENARAAFVSFVDSLKENGYIRSDEVPS